jgi:hypothetical protein
VSSHRIGGQRPLVETVKGNTTLQATQDFVDSRLKTVRVVERSESYTRLQTQLSMSTSDIVVDGSYYVLPLSLVRDSMFYNPIFVNGEISLSQAFLANPFRYS